MTLMDAELKNLKIDRTRRRPASPPKWADALDRRRRGALPTAGRGGEFASEQLNAAPRGGSAARASRSARPRARGRR